MLLQGDSASTVLTKLIELRRLMYNNPNEDMDAFTRRLRQETLKAQHSARCLAKAQKRVSRMDAGPDSQQAVM
jgi:hypothetical protein